MGVHGVLPRGLVLRNEEQAADLVGQVVLRPVATSPLSLPSLYDSRQRSSLRPRSGGSPSLTKQTLDVALRLTNEDMPIGQWPLDMKEMTIQVSFPSCAGLAGS